VDGLSWFIQPINGKIEMMFSGINPVILPLSIIDTQHGLSPLLIVENLDRPSES
jgi:hypothetical protein